MSSSNRRRSTTFSEHIVLPESIEVILPCEGRDSNGPLFTWVLFSWRGCCALQFLSWLLDRFDFVVREIYLERLEISLEIEIG